MPSTIRKLRLPRLRSSAVALAFGLAITSMAGFAAQDKDGAQTFQPVSPTIDQARANILIARQLQFTHFLDQRIDSDLSKRVFDAYLDHLDGQHVYFLQSDIDRFSPWRTKLDSALKTGQLEPAFQIYNLFEKRVIERLDYALKLIDDGVDQFDFSKDEELKLDRSNNPWAKSEDELDAIWKRRIKNAVLAQRLNGKSDKEITTSLKRRYESQRSRTLQVRSEDAFQTYMNAFTSLWDPHTSYFSPRTSENFNINMSLSLEGIGAVLQSDNEYTKVVRLVPGGPASKQGQLKPADRIVGVAQGKDGEMKNVVGWRLDEVVDLIRGPRSSVVRLEVIPASASDETITRTIDITRDKVKLEEQSAKSDMIDLKRDGKNYKVGVIDIPTFYADFQAMQAGDPNYKSTTRDVRKLIDKLKEQGMQGLVIDLRNNGGGALQEANDLIGLFIDEGPTVQIRSADNDVSVLTDDDPSVAYSGPLVVLVNRMSASASEIFAGAIQDYGRGLIVGSQTFGKGTVQAVRPLNHGQLKITQSKFYRVSGGSTQHKGVIPDINIPTRINKEEIGEDALDNALPWDQIEAVPHARYFDFSSVIGKLRERHEARFAKNPEFQLLEEEINLLKSQRNREYVSLNYKERETYQDDLESRQLKIANARRQLKGKEPFKNWEALENYEEEEAAKPEDQDDDDFIVREGGYIMSDMIELDSRMASIDPPERITAQADEHL
ncbi:tail-specific protease [Marinobacter halodurans]|uniref:Tail-specific protease n=1 Tax=Marinobacter halodurans TaxID=2528979 RepID=A0ABY1ZHN0_9GAMM|nr:carboxy terminal-processing peptidase [Marinobacter halodurans]TBW53312.1 tail-specific protease [Marinobacter halodurans]